MIDIASYPLITTNTEQGGGGNSATLRASPLTFAKKMRTTPISNLLLMCLASTWTFACREGHRNQAKLDTQSDTFRDEARQKLKAALDYDAPPTNAEFDDAAVGYYYSYRMLRAAENESDPSISLSYFQISLSYLNEVKARFPDWKTAIVANRKADVQTKLLAAQEDQKHE